VGRNLTAMGGILTVDRSDRSDTNLSNLAEAILNGANNPGANCLVNWDAVPGSQVKVRVYGRFVTSGGTTTIKVRVGASTPDQPENTGTVELTFTTTGTEFVAAASGFFAKPGGQSYLRVTGINSLASQTVQVDGLVVVIESDVDHSAILLNNNRSNTRASFFPEVVVKEWIVDFDRFGEGSQLLVDLTLSVLTVGDDKTIRLRIGGTTGAVNGTSVLSFVNPIHQPAGSGRTVNTGTTIARPTGLQPVKLTLQTNDGFEVDVKDVSIILSGV
jgi:hypothetical protein